MMEGNLESVESSSQDALADVKFTPHATIFALLSAAIKIRDMSKAEKLFDHLVKEYKFTQPHVFNAMMEGYVVTGDPASAFKVFKQMLASDLKPSKLSLITIVRALAQNEKDYASVISMIFDEMVLLKIPLNLLLRHPDLKGAEILRLQQLVDEYCQAKNVQPNLGDVNPRIFKDFVPEEVLEERVRSMEQVKIPRSIDSSGIHDMRTTLEIMTDSTLDLRTKQEELEISSGLVAQRRLTELAADGRLPNTLRSEELTEIVKEWREVLTPKVQDEIDRCKTSAGGCLFVSFFLFPFFLFLFFPPSPIPESTT